MNSPPFRLLTTPETCVVIGPDSTGEGERTWFRRACGERGSSQSDCEDVCNLLNDAWKRKPWVAGQDTVLSELRKENTSLWNTISQQAKIIREQRDELKGGMSPENARLREENNLLKANLASCNLLLISHLEKEGGPKEEAPLCKRCKRIRDKKYDEAYTENLRRETYIRVVEYLEGGSDPCERRTQS